MALGTGKDLLGLRGVPKEVILDIFEQCGDVEKNTGYAWEKKASHLSGKTGGHAFLRKQHADAHEF